jgi:hypothetical protein
VAQALRPADRVTYCMKQPRNDRVEIVKQHHSNGECSCQYRGIARCADVWACPVCGRMISSRRAAEVETAADQWIAEGGAIALVTLTMPHSRDDDLADLLRWLGDGLQRTKRGNPWKRISDRFGWIGQITAKEATYGDSAGWHPHFHLVAFVAGDTDAQALEDAIAPRWRSMIAKASGREPNEHGCRVSVRNDSRAAGVAGAYLTKGAWSAGSELTGTASKEAKAGRYTPRDVLAAAGEAMEEDDEAARARWAARWDEYVEAYRGRRQVVWSPGLKARFEVGEVADEEAIEAEDEPAETVAALGPRAWKAVRAERAEGLLLAIASGVGHEGVRRWLALRGWDCGLEDPPFLEALSPDMAARAGPS